QSLSGFEMSLAGIAANSGWSAQEICDVLVSFRDKEKGRWHGRSYYRATIAKALGNAARHRRERREGAFQVPREEDEDQGSGNASGSIPATGEVSDTPRLLNRLNSAVILKGRSLRFTNVKRRGSCYVAFDDLGHEIQLGTVREMNAFSVTQA